MRSPKPAFLRRLRTHNSPSTYGALRSATTDCHLPSRRQPSPRCVANAAPADERPATSRRLLGHERPTRKPGAQVRRSLPARRRRRRRPPGQGEGPHGAPRCRLPLQDAAGPPEPVHARRARALDGRLRPPPRRPPGGHALPRRRLPRPPPVRAPRARPRRGAPTRGRRRRLPRCQARAVLQRAEARRPSRRGVPRDHRARGGGDGVGALHGSRLPHGRPDRVHLRQPLHEVLPAGRRVLGEVPGASVGQPDVGVFRVRWTDPAVRHGCICAVPRKADPRRAVEPRSGGGDGVQGGGLDGLHMRLREAAS
ncbi:hypothetical protein ACQJBY_045084 [Aegilops geniculata]